METTEKSVRPRSDGHVGERLYQLRVHQGYSQKEIEQLTDGVIPERTYRAWEADESVPRLGPALRALANLFRVSSEWVLFGDEGVRDAVRRDDD